MKARQGRLQPRKDKSGNTNCQIKLINNYDCHWVHYLLFCSYNPGRNRRRRERRRVLRAMEHTQKKCAERNAETAYVSRHTYTDTVDWIWAVSDSETDDTSLSFFPYTQRKQLPNFEVFMRWVGTEVPTTWFYSRQYFHFFWLSPAYTLSN